MTAGAKPRTSHHPSSGGDQGCEGCGVGLGGGWGGGDGEGERSRRRRMEALPEECTLKGRLGKALLSITKKQTLELCHEEKHGKSLRETYFPERSDTIMN